MNESLEIFEEPADVASRLFELNLTPEILLYAIEYGVRHAFECTANDPRSLAGLLI